MMNPLLVESLSHSIDHRYNPKDHHGSCRDPRCRDGRAAVVEAATVNLQTRGLYAPFAKVSVYKLTYYLFIFIY